MPHQSKTSPLPAPVVMHHKTKTLAPPPYTTLRDPQIKLSSEAKAGSRTDGRLAGAIPKSISSTPPPTHAFANNGNYTIREGKFSNIGGNRVIEEYESDSEGEQEQPDQQRKQQGSQPERRGCFVSAVHVY